MINLNYIKYQLNWSNRVNFLLFNKKNIIEKCIHQDYNNLYIIDEYVGSTLGSNRLKLIEYYNKYNILSLRKEHD